MREIFRSKQTPREWWGVQGPVTRENGLTKYEVVDREISRICRGIETLVGCGELFAPKARARCARKVRVAVW